MVKKKGKTKSDKTESPKPKKVRKPKAKAVEKKPGIEQPKGDRSSNVDKLIERSREAASIAKLKLYQTLTRKIAEGRQLTATELKQFNSLDRDFNGEPNGGPKEVFDSFDDALSYLGVSRRTLSVHIKKGTIRQNEDGTFFKAELDKYLSQYGRKTKEQKTSSEDIEEKKNRADLRYRLARARREEMLVDQLKGLLIERKDVYAEWAGRVALVTSALENFADRLPPLLEGKTRGEMFEVIKGEVWELRNGFCREGRYCPATDERN